jgi:hypothetical protein
MEMTKSGMELAMSGMELAINGMELTKNGMEMAFPDPVLADARTGDLRPPVIMPAA